MIRDMKRRSYLATLGSLGTTLTLVGCLASDEEAGSSSVTDPTVGQGETAIVTIEGTDVGSIRFTGILEGSDSPNNDEPLEIQFENAEFTPSPDVVWQADPPTWEWSSTQTVEGEVPIQTTSETPPGTYEFAVTVSKANSDEKVTKKTTITVE